MKSDSRVYDENYSIIRFLHAVPRGKPVDIYFNNSLFFNRILFTQFTPYIYVPEGTYEVTIFETGTRENPILRESLEVQRDKMSTLAMTGYEDDLELLLINEAKEESENSDLSKVRIVHLSPNLPKLNIYLNDKIVFPDVDFREVTDYVEVPAYDIYTLDIVLEKSGRLLRSNQIAVNVDRVYSLYLLGNFANFQVFQSRDGTAFVNTVVRD
ncbi:DUF4397 domain-containing protein [Romboutsia lituseburensis]|uniref:DUF4397 domain-containing protein n=1 Tax=Romboutsia lituseburensis DSM 797 TaxID=1121325 RepID=A0A1G9J9V8_9FIRM|nr:DUF4397 domain-containing protein [Romboutsia lituseburensis]CEH33570.1 Domain of unknown function (DUF4397) [Romboutsia lituseburensis]SDL34340.1 protein of unknown function [Romboutsia lituseburensis DSM 797]